MMARVDTAGFSSDPWFDYNEEFFATDGLTRLRAWAVDHLHTAPCVQPALRLGPPVSRLSKIVCIGVNFRDHAAESKMEIPKEPVIFFKAATAIVGPNDSLVMPRGATKVDREVELAVVISRKASYVSREEALNCVAGCVLHNDHSGRNFQLERGGQSVKGKSADTFAPPGPFLATPDELPELNRLKMWLKVNGEFRENSSTAQMIFGVAELVS